MKEVNGMKPTTKYDDFINGSIGEGKVIDSSKSKLILIKSIAIQTKSNILMLFMGAVASFYICKLLLGSSPVVYPNPVSPPWGYSGLLVLAPIRNPGDQISMYLHIFTIGLCLIICAVCIIGLVYNLMVYVYNGLWKKKYRV